MAETVMPRAYGVSEINNYLREYLDEEEFLADLLVRGELTSYKRHSSGHIYFTLTEAGCSISGAMFRAQAAQADFLPEAGLEVVVYGSVGLYERDGRAQLYARAFFPVGAGSAGQALTQLKHKLDAEGLFAAERKKTPPLIPSSLGVVTAQGSAAWADIQAVAAKRWPGLPIMLYPTLVQGADAPASIALAIAKADKAGHGVLIVGRGGGANEDLAAFNTETVARAVAAAATPLISAVGHEIDLTLTDLAADLRAATPSHAAVLAVPERDELCRRLTQYQRRLQQAAANGVLYEQRRLRTAQNRLAQAAALALRRRQSALGLAAARLEALSPLSTLARGYAICRDDAGHSLRDAKQAQPGQHVSVRLYQGGLGCTVDEILGEE